MAKRILIVDDEENIGRSLRMILEREGYGVNVCRSVAEFRAHPDAGRADAYLLDMKLPDGSGIDLLKQNRAAGLETTFVMVTAFASVETAVEALRAGAYDYLIKPVRHAELLHRLSQIEAVRGLRDENRALRRAVKDAKPVCTFTSQSMRRIERLIDKVAPTDSTVLITGASGTGKTVVAHALHERSSRCNHPFLAVNCAAIPDQLLESEFFGNVKGAFTGADRTRKGLFVEVERGTLFLDEISELPLHMQTKLLHAIEDKQVRPIGGSSSRHVDVRIVAATNRDLQALVARGGFREDLYFRLSMFEVSIPPLRERPEDIRALISFALQANQHMRGTSKPFELDPEAEQILMTHDWPGNVRELENVINRACILVEDHLITVDELPAELSRRSLASAAAADSSSLRERLRRVEAEIVMQAIRDAGGDRKLAAQNLGISLSGLYAKVTGRNGDSAA